MTLRHCDSVAREVLSYCHTVPTKTLRQWYTPLKGCTAALSLGLRYGVRINHSATRVQYHLGVLPSLTCLASILRASFRRLA